MVTDRDYRLRTLQQAGIYFTPADDIPLPNGPLLR